MRMWGSLYSWGGPQPGFYSWSRPTLIWGSCESSRRKQIQILTRLMITLLSGKSGIVIFISDGAPFHKAWLWISLGVADWFSQEADIEMEVSMYEFIGLLLWSTPRVRKGKKPYLEEEEFGFWCRLSVGSSQSYGKFGGWDDLAEFPTLGWGGHTFTPCHHTNQSIHMACPWMKYKLGLGFFLQQNISEGGEVWWVWS